MRLKYMICFYLNPIVSSVCVFTLDSSNDKVKYLTVVLCICSAQLKYIMLPSCYRSDEMSLQTYGCNSHK